MKINISLSLVSYKCKALSKKFKKIVADKTFTVDAKNTITELVFDPMLDYVVTGDKIWINSALGLLNIFISKVKAIKTKNIVHYAVKVEFNNNHTLLLDYIKELNMVLAPLNLLCLVKQIDEKYVDLIIIKSKLEAVLDIIKGFSIQLEDLKIEIPDQKESEKAFIQKNTFIPRPRGLNTQQYLAVCKDYEYTKFFTSDLKKIADPVKSINHLKSTVVADLAQSSGINESKINNIIADWANSSTTTNSLKLQLAIIDIFSITSNVYFDALTKDKGKRKVVPDKDHYTLAETIYKNTQKLLEKHKMKEILVYRGLSIPKIDNSIVSSSMNSIANPMSSFSNAFSISKQFATGSAYFNLYGEESKFPYVAAANFPADRIFSTSFTGIGCTLEMEFIVLGGEYNLNYDPLIYDLISESAFRYGNYKDIKSKKGKDLIEKLRLEAPNKVLLKEDYEETFSRLTDLSNVLGVEVRDLVNAAKESMSKENYTTFRSSLSAKQKIHIDADSINADWTKQSWDLPEFGSSKFNEYLRRSGITLAQFKQTNVYKHAVKNGVIHED